MFARFLVFPFLVAVLAFPLKTSAQHQSAPDESGVFRDSLRGQQQPYLIRPYVLPGSERVFMDGVPLDTSMYRIDTQHGKLWLKTPPADSIPVVILYRTLPFNFKEVYARDIKKAVAERDSLSQAQKTAASTDLRRPTDPFGNSKLQRSGSITRGIIAGNNRDVSLESGLRMQLSGEVVDGVNVQAVLTDENTPIQPEGTTQRLSEFDRVAIQVRTAHGLAQLGDFDLIMTDTRFAEFTRKLQGISLTGDLPPAGGDVFAGGRVTLAGATSRGQYRIQTITPIDGVQGPYRLEGASGEQFIVIIAGSEIVYVDGRRMERGETNDYVIDYQTGEITFTPSRLITEDRRIQVEFQYTTGEYTRTLVATDALARFWRNGAGAARGYVGARVIREADGRQFNAELGLTSLDSLLLVQAGDALASRSGAERVSFDPEASFVQYVRRPSPDQANDSIFVALDQVPGDSIPVYRVRFTRVGSGRGSYNRQGQAVNGLLYRYVGAGRGEYEPVRTIPSPEQKRLVDLHGGFAPVKGITVFGEWARSLYDKNRLSLLDSEDDVGKAYTAGLQIDTLAVPFGAFSQARLSAGWVRRHTGAHFNPFNRIRPVEFERKWNLISRQNGSSGFFETGTDEDIDEASLQFNLSDVSYVRAEWGRIDLGHSFSGIRRNADIRFHEHRLPGMSYQLEWVDSRDSLLFETGAWLRQLGSIQYSLMNDRLTPRFEIEQERRRQWVTGTDSLANSSYSFVEYRPSLNWKAGKLETGAELEYRDEQDWAGGAIRPSAKAWTVLSRLSYSGPNSFLTEASAGYRVRRFEEYFRIQDRSENSESVVLQWNNRYAPFNRAIETNWFYEALTERTPKQQEMYVRTGPEYPEAAYVWEDDGDGILELDEFIPERTPNEGEYVLLFVPSDSLISVISVQARLRVQLDPGRIWRNTGGLRGVLSNVTSRTTIEIVEKSRDPELAHVYLLNLGRFRDSFYTLNGRMRLVQEVYLFRNSRKYGLDFSWNQIRSLTQLAAGEENLFTSAFRTEARYRPADTWSMRVTSQLEHNRTFSEQFSSRRFDIVSRQIEPQLTVLPVPSLQISGGVSLSSKSDAVETRRAGVIRLPLEFRLTLVNRFQWMGRVEMANVRVRGEASGLAEYELTDGRGPGTSFLWGANGQYTINQYLRASLTYDGRAPADARILHTMRFQLSATF